MAADPTQPMGMDEATKILAGYDPKAAPSASPPPAPGQAPAAPATGGAPGAAPSGGMDTATATDILKNWTPPGGDAGPTPGPAATGPKPTAPAKPTPASMAQMDTAHKINTAEGGKPGASPGTSSAEGYGQFTKGTWGDFMAARHPDLVKTMTPDQVLALRDNEQFGMEAINWYAQRNTPILQKHGIPVNDASLYGMHFLGNDFLKLMQADQDQSVHGVVPDAVIAANHNIFIDKKTNHYRTVGDVRNIIANRVGEQYMPEPLHAGMIGEALENAPGSIASAAHGIADAFRFPGDVVDAGVALGKGAISKGAGALGFQQDPTQKAATEAPLDSFLHQQKQKLGLDDYTAQEARADPIGFAKHVGSSLINYGVHDPAGAVMDASIAIPVVGEVTGALGKGIEALRGVEAAGELAPSLARAAAKVSPDIAEGATKEGAQAAVGVTKAKGFSPEAVDEATIRAANPQLKVTRAMVTGESPSEEAAAVHNDAVTHNNTILGQEAEKLAGPADPESHVATGQALANAYVDSHNAASGRYQTVAGLGGSYGPAMDAGRVQSNLIDAGLQKAGVTPTEVARSVEYPQTRAAVQMLQDALTGGPTKTLRGGGLDIPEIMAQRKELSAYQRAATGSDRYAMGQLIDQYHNHLADEADLGSFVDAGGNPLPGVSGQLRDAAQGYKAHKALFEDTRGLNAPVAKAIDKMGTPTFDPTGAMLPITNPDAHTAIGEAFEKNLFSKGAGPAAHTAFGNAVGNTDLPDALMRRRLLATDANGKLTPDAVKLMNSGSPLIDRAFAGNPRGAARARLIHKASQLTNRATKLKPSLKHRAMVMAGKAVGRTAGAAIGYHHAGIPGMFFGAKIEPAIIENAIRAVQKRHALTGAKTPLLRSARRAVGHTLSPRTAAKAHYAAQAAQQNQPIPSYARGGSVDPPSVDDLVDRLMARAKAAKKTTDETTKPLLKAPDEAVVKALAVANEAI